MNPEYDMIIDQIIKSENSAFTEMRREEETQTPSQCESTLCNNKKFIISHLSVCIITALITKYYYSHY